MQKKRSFFLSRELGGADTVGESSHIRDERGWYRGTGRVFFDLRSTMRESGVHPFKEGDYEERSCCLARRSGRRHPGGAGDGGSLVLRNGKSSADLLQQLRL